MFSEYRRHKTQIPKERVIQELKVPAKLVRECPGLALDIGGSVMKVVYRTKKDFEDAQSLTDPTAMGTVRLTSFTRAEMDQAFDFIRENVHMTEKSSGEQLDINCAGWGGSQFKAKLEKELNLKIHIQDEGVCFNKAFIYLVEHLTMDDLVHPFDEAKTKKELEALQVAWGPMIQQIKDGHVKMEIPGFTPETLTVEKLYGSIYDEMKITGDRSKTMLSQGNSPYPAALAMCGSAFGLLKNTGEGDGYIPMDMSNRGGRMCLAMTSLLLGCKDYEEFLALAEAGNCEALDYCMNDYGADMMAGAAEGADEGQGEQEQNAYNIVADASKEPANSLLFCLGKAVGKKLSDFKREDVAAAFLRMVCNDLVMLVDYAMMMEANKEIKHLFFCGGFPSNDLTRNILALELINRFNQRALSGLGGRPYQAHFLKHGAHLGSIGCLVMDPPSAAEAEAAATQ